jgi:hypothetical protein
VNARVVWVCGRVSVLCAYVCACVRVCVWSCVRVCVCTPVCYTCIMCLCVYTYCTHSLIHTHTHTQATGAIAEQIKKDFGSYDEFKKQFET